MTTKSTLKRLKRIGLYRCFMPLVVVLFMPGCSTPPELSSTPVVTATIEATPTATSEPSTPAQQVKTSALSEEDLIHIEEAWDTQFKSVTGLVIRQGGEVVYESYGGRQSAESLMEVYSVTKSVTSLLTGIALYEGALDSLDAPINLFLPEYMADLAADTQTITIANVLSMATGLESGWSMEGVPITAYRGDLHKRALALEQTDPPGTISRYSTVATSLMTGVLEAATDEDLEAFAERTLFEPLGIETWKWYRDDTGRATSSSGLRLRTTDMAKIGQLILNEGMWDGERLLSAEYIQTATKALYPSDWGEGQTRGYGYLFWISNSAEFDNFMASGYGGQVIYGVPDRDLVVAISTPCCATDGWTGYKLVEEVIAPLVEPNEKACTDTTGEQTTFNVPLSETSHLINYIYLPPCYNETTRTYPVLYLLHGGGLSQSTWITRLGAGDVADDLIASGEIEPLIVISPPAPASRKLDDYLFDRLLPFVADNYRINGRRGLAGMSLGGGLTARIGLTNPDQFDALGILSMTYVGGTKANMEAWLAAVESPPALYLDVGEDDTFLRYHEEMQTMLEARGFDFTYETHAGGHQLDYWGDLLPTYLRWFDAQFTHE